MSSDPDHETLEFYRRTAPAYVALSAGKVSRLLPRFLTQLPQRASILDLGCGGGIDAKVMIEAGHLVDVTDGVQEMAKLAEEYLDCPVRVMRFDELQAVEIYDAVWANGSLLHVPRLSLPHILALIHNALKPGGLFQATYKSGAFEGRDRFGRYFNYLSPKIAAEVYASSGRWEQLSVTEYSDESYHGNMDGPWIEVLVRRMD